MRCAEKKFPRVYEAVSQTYFIVLGFLVAVVDFDGLVLSYPKHLGHTPFVGSVLDIQVVSWVEVDSGVEALSQTKPMRERLVL